VRIGCPRNPQLCPLNQLKPRIMSAQSRIISAQIKDVRSI
jgi:hypothetical protein